MSRQVLNIIDNATTSLGIEYGFVTYSKYPVVYPYFVGEYTETEPFREDGLQESTFLLTGFHRGTWLELEVAKEKIEKHFNKVSGKVAVAEDGSAAAIFYANALIVPTGDADLKSIQINLTIKEWKVN